MKVKIQNLIDAFETDADGTTPYLNIETGDVIAVSDDDAALAEDKCDLDDLADWHREVVREAIAVAEGKGTIYRELPSGRDLGEYGLMREFIDDLDNPVAAEDLSGAIRGKGAFRRFKDTAIHYGLEDAWYAFRAEAFRALARAWCDENGVACEG